MQIDPCHENSVLQVMFITIIYTHSYISVPKIYLRRSYAAEEWVTADNIDRHGTRCICKETTWRQWSLS